MSEENSRPRQLGRGLEALFGDNRAEKLNNFTESPEKNEDPRAEFRSLPVERLQPNPRQPRCDFDDAALEELTQSIAEHGILQPLIVRPLSVESKMFEIVAGERRWRAAQRAQVHEAPVIVGNFSDAEALAVALVENIQRNELSPLEEAEAYARLGSDFNKTQAQVAKIVGKSRSHVANMMRLLELPEDVRAMVSAGQLSAGHARAILRAADPGALAGIIVEGGLSVRDAEQLAKSGPGKKSPRRPSPPKDADTLALERELTNGLGAKVEISFNGSGGYVRVNYRSLEQLDDLVERLMA
ncbi:MAG: ParB/RepB/Spo0J family partition protein [Pseudomonadota bacterium]|nr:ParB/RepB/Spo0J family partition protein [Pseudomonadota bacterium]